MSKRAEVIIDVKTEISQVKQSAQQMREIFDKMDLSDSVRRSFSNTFTKLEKEIRNFEVVTNKGLSSLSDTKKAINGIDKINDLFENLKIQMKDTQKFKLDKIVSSDVTEKLKKYKSTLEQIVNLQNKNNSNKIEKAEEAKAAALEKREEAQRKLNTSIEKTKSLDEEKTRISKQIEDETAAIDKLAKKRQELASIRKRTGEQQAEFSTVKADYEAVEKALIRHKNELKKNEDEINKINLANKNLTSSLSEAESKFNSTVQKLEEAKRASSITEEEFKKLKKAIAELDGSSVDALPNNLQELEQKLRQLDPTEKILEEINSSFSRMTSSAMEAGTAIKGAGEKAQQAKGSFEALEKTNEQMDQLKSRLTYFFSAMNGIQLFKNAIRSAYESVKELDAAITEMAVVTDYSINDIWGNIPEYTRTATELGATTKDVINSMVLYTQQGLKMSQATELSTQTMKMARIAGLEGAEATDLMTAALRGFNMELNEASAQRVNDVYSNLAANAAANTHEIADAMTRTASIANAAGMEFETTAAFLTQMIETTRESAENLGTAMKTIVARFTEMKKAPGEIVEVDGEEVNVNKVEAALKSVGVQLRDTQGQFRELDDVFLELASKWDSLDVMSQRYVATMAAGSRQQSRFIAMMSNYQRTMELTGYATNSAGASQKQFEKTMDSLESKLNRLHDAWEQYVTGIANQSIIKGVVDLLTSLLETVNKVTDALDPFHTGWSKILAAFLGFKAAKGVVNGVLKGIGTQLGTRKPNQTTVPGGEPTKTDLDEKQGAVDGTKYGKGFWGAFQKMQAQKKDPMGTRPITNNIKQSKQLTKEAAELKKNSAALKSQGTELTKLEKQYKNYSNTIATANTQGKNSQKIASKSRTAILQQNLALQRQEASLRENLSVESEAYKQSVVRTAKLQEQEAALTGKSAALTKDTAEQFANTSSEELNTAAATANQGATEMETAAKEKEALATEMNTAITTKDTIEQEANNMTRLQAIAGLFSLNSAKRLAAAVSLGLMSAEEAQAIATKGATAAQTAFNAALYACPIMWIVAGIAAIVAAIAIFATIHETTEEKVQRLNKSVEQLGTQMNETQEVINDLTDSWEKLSGLKDDLNNLTVGTTEWKKKLIEVNQEVLNLLDKYPQLAQYVSKNANGEFEINKSGYDKVLDTQLDSLTRQQQAYSFAQALSADMQRTQLSEEHTYSYTEKQKNEQQMSQRAIERDSFFSAGITNLGTDYSDKQKKIGNLLTDEEKSLISTVSANEQSLKNFEKIKSKTSASVTEYARLTGLTEAQVKAKKDQNELDDDAIKTLIATNKYQKEYEKQAAQLVSILRSNNLTGMEKRAISGTNSLTLEDVKNKDINDVFSKYIKDGVVKIDEDDSDSIKKILTDTFGFEEGTLNSLLEAGASLESIVQNFVNSEASLKSYEENLSKLGRVNSDSFSNFTNSIQKFSKQKLSTDQLNQLSKTFLKVKEQGGDIKSFSSQLESIVSTIKKPEDLQKFISSLNSVDFSSETAIRTFTDNLSELGINLQENVKSELVDAAEAARDFDLSKVTDQLMNFELAEQIQSKAKDNNRIFTADEYKKIEEDERAKKFLPDFVQRGTNYVFTGDWDALTKVLLAADDIVKAEEDYTKALLDLNDKQKKYADTQSKAGNLQNTNNKTIWDFDDSWIKGNLRYFINGTPKKFNNPGELDADYTNSLIYQYNEAGEVVSDPNGEADVAFDWDKIAQIFAEANENEDFAKALPADFYKKVGERIAAEYVEDNTPEQGAAIDAIRRFLGVEFDAVTFDELEGLLSDYSNKNDTWTNTQLAANQKFLKPYLENNIITQTQYEEWSKKTAEEVRQLINSINFNKESTDAFSTKQNLESKQFIGLTSAKDILSITPETKAGLKAQQEAIEAIIVQHKDYEIELQKIQKELGLTEEAAKKYLAVQYEQREATNSIKTVLSDYKDTLSADNLSLTKNTEDYYTAISLLVDKFKVLFGENITQEWVENNLDAIRELNSSDLSVAQQAMEKLQSTAEATKFTFNTIGTGDANGEIDETIFAKISKSIEQAQKDINTNTNNLTTDFNTIKSALQELDGSEASISIKANTRTKAMEAIKDMMAVIVAQKFAESDPSKVATYDSKLQILRQLASSLGFSVNIASNVGTGYEHGGATLRWDSKSNKWVDIKDTFDAKRMITITDTQGQQVTMKTPEAAGTGNTTNSSSKDSDSDKKSTKDTTSTWTNDYDKYYNTLKKIEGLERRRTELEKQQSRLIKQRYLDEEKIKANKKAQVDLLRQQARINSDLADTAAAYLRGDSNGDVWFDEATGTIQTNPNAANYNEEQMKAFNDQKSLMEDHYEIWKEVKDNLEDIYDAIDELTEVAEFSLEDLTDSVDRAVEILDNTLTNLDREISRLDRYDSGATSSDYKKRYEQSAQIYADKYNQLTTKKAINEQQLNSQMNSEYGKYINVNWETKEVTKSASYFAITDPDVKNSVDDFVSNTQELASNIIDMDNQQEEIRDSLYELQQTLADKSLEFQEKIYDAVIKSREDEITTLNNIDNSIKNAASDLISSVQKNLQKIRQDRQNQDKEEELQNMEARLAYYQVDTSNANQKNILDLQKQLEDKQRSYTDTLIDQKISELQQQNDDAAAQRKRQIEIMETQLELDKENGVIWKAVDTAIRTGFNSSGRIQKGSDLYNMLSSLDEVTKKNSVQFEHWFGELNNLAAAYNANLTADLDTSGQMSNTVSNANNAYGENSEYIKSLKSRLEAMNRDGNFNHLVWYDQEGQKVKYKYNITYFDNETERLEYDKKVKDYQALARELANARAFYKTNKNASFTSAFNRLYGYDSGGLADYTGLAWLDGSPSSPELVLNARDTENFIQLKDILSDITNKKINTTDSNGDFYFEIYINVDKVAGDYDVDQITNRVKQQIKNEARARNVNIINLIK